MRPQPASIMSGSTTWQRSKMPRTFTANTCSNSSWLILRNLENGEMPALLIRIVAAPSRSRTSATPASIWSRLLTSTVTPIAVPPSATMASAVATALSPLRSRIATDAPSWARRVAMAIPMPEPPPVTIAVRGVDQAGTGVMGERSLVVEGLYRCLARGPVSHQPRRGIVRHHVRFGSNALASASGGTSRQVRQAAELALAAIEKRSR